MSLRIYCVVLAGLLSILVGTVAPMASSEALAQSSRDEREASEQAIFISELEAQGRFNRIYGLMHSDSKAIAPREAVVG